MATRVAASETQGQQVDARPIIVGVDTGGRSTGAAVWAAAEATSSGRALHLMSVYPDFEASSSNEAATRKELADLAGRLSVANLEYDVAFGSPALALLDAAADGSLLVVGRRGRAALQPRLVGSTSIAVSGLSPAPVVVVPEHWLESDRPADAPVVVGVEAPGEPILSGAAGEERIQDPDPDQDALEFAFEQAGRLQIPLVVLTAFEVPLIYGWSSEDIDASRDRARRAIAKRLGRWREAYPKVDVDIECIAETPRQALLEASRVARLTVLGRHGRAHLNLMTLGRTTRGVLEHAEHPVAVVPVRSGASREERS